MRPKSPPEATKTSAGRPSLRSMSVPTVLCIVFLSVLCIPALANPTFQMSALDTGHPVGQIATADFDGDGIRDVAVSAADANLIQVFSGSSSGSFILSATLAVDGLSAPIATADFNGDGKADMVSWGITSYSVYLGNGSGGFTSTHTFYESMLNPPNSIAVADFNADGAEDLAVCFAFVGINISGQGLQIMMGNGNGTFAAEGPRTYGAGLSNAHPVYLNFITWDDISHYHDSNLDLVLEFSYGSPVVRGGVGDGSFEYTPFGSQDSALYPGPFIVGDFDGDSFTDLIRWDTWYSLGFYKGASDGNTGDPNNPFTQVRRFITEGAAAPEFSEVIDGPIDIADLTLDGKPDLITVNTDTRDISVLKGLGLGDFANGELFGVGDEPTGRPMAVADMNADGKPDLVVPCEGGLVRIYLNTSDQTPIGTDTSIIVNSTDISFENVTSGGTTTVTPIDPATAGDVPGGFALANIAFEVSTTATFTGEITSCFTVSSVNVETDFFALRVLHNEGGSLVDRTSSHDFANRKICATTTSFSPFYLARIGNTTEYLFDRSRAFKSGSTIPIKLKLRDAGGQNISSSSKQLYVRNLIKVGSNTTSAVNDPGESNPDYQFRFATDQYQYNLKTTGLSPGRYVLSYYAGSDTGYFFTLTFEVR